MAKQTSYSIYGESNARKAFRRLNFVDARPRLSTSVDQNEKAKTVRQKAAATVTAKLEEAMLNFYAMTYKDWINKYWHEAIRPDLVATIDSSQREEVYQAFTTALTNECLQNHAEITEFYEAVTNRMDDASADEHHYDIIRKILVYARNFEMRTHQKLQAIYSLNQNYSYHGSKGGIMQYAKSEFGRLVFDNELSAMMMREAVSSISCSVRDYVNDPSARKEHESKIIFASLLAKMLRSFFVGNRVPGGFNPVTLAGESVMAVIRDRINPFSSDYAVPEEYNSISMSQIQRNGDLLEYMQRTVIVIVEDWIRRLNTWTEFALGLTKLVGELSETVSDVGVDSLISESTGHFLDNNIDSVTGILSLYAVTRLATNGGNPGHDPAYAYQIPASTAVLERLAERLYDKTVQQDSMNDNTMHSTSASSKFVNFGKAAAQLKHILRDREYAAFQEIVHRKLAASDIYVALHHDLVSKARPLEDAQRIAALLGIVPDNPKNDSYLNDWQEHQYHSLIEDVAIGLLPREIGGRGTDPKDGLDAYVGMQKISKDIFGAFPLALAKEASHFNKLGSALLLHYGNWMCTEDPSLSEEAPDALKPYVDLVALSKMDNTAWELKWHKGWSAVRCTVNLQAGKVEFGCTLLQYEIIKALLQSSIALPAKALLPNLLPEIDFIEQTVEDLHQNSGGFLKMTSADGTKFYAIDTRAAASGNYCQIRFCDEL